MDDLFRVACVAGGYAMKQLIPSEWDIAHAIKE